MGLEERSSKMNASRLAKTVCQDDANHDDDDNEHEGD
jgi:hypothetical protein